MSLQSRWHPETITTVGHEGTWDRMKGSGLGSQGTQDQGGVLCPYLFWLQGISYPEMSLGRMGGRGSEQIAHCRKEQPQPAGTMHSSPHTLPAQMEQQDSPADCTQGQEITSREKWQPAGQAKCCLPARRG